MKFAPRKWTHHHTHRLFHILMLTHVVFIVGVIFFGVGVLAWQAKGDTFGAGDVNVAAQVGEIDQGPSTGSGSGQPLPPPPPVAPQPVPPVPQPTPQPPPTQYPANTSCSTSSDSGEAMTISGKTFPILTSARPTFEGLTNIYNAIVRLEIDSKPLIRATIHADDSGHWSWQSTENISSGRHTLTVTAANQLTDSIHATCQYDFYIRPASVGPTPPPTGPVVFPSGPSQGFDILVTIANDHKRFQPGDDLLAQIKVTRYDSSAEPSRVPVEYTILDSAGRVIMQNSEIVTVLDSITYLKTFYTAPTLKPGMYKLSAKISTGSMVALSTDYFEISGAGVITVGSAKADYTIVFEILIGLLLLFCFIAYLEYTKVSMLSSVIKQIDEESLRPDIAKN